MTHKHFAYFCFVKISKLVFSNPIICMSTRIIHCEDLCIISIAMQVSTKDTTISIFCWLQYNGTSTITKDDRDISSTGTKVKSERMFFTGNNKYVFIHACSDKLISCAKCIHKPGTLISY